MTNSNNKVFNSEHNDSITVPDTQHSLQVPLKKLPKKLQDMKYRYTSVPWQTVTILGPAGSKKGKHKDWDGEYEREYQIGQNPGWCIGQLSQNDTQLIVI